MSKATKITKRKKPDRLLGNNISLAGAAMPQKFTIICNFLIQNHDIVPNAEVDA